MEQLKTWWTPARKAARVREDELLRARYAGRYVAYVDEWAGEELVRTVVAVADSPTEFQRLVAGLEPDLRQRARLEAVAVAAPLPFA